MTPLPRTWEWMLKVKSSYNFLKKSKLRNGTKTFLEPKLLALFIVKLKKLGFSVPLSDNSINSFQDNSFCKHYMYLNQMQNCICICKNWNTFCPY